MVELSNPGFWGIGPKVESQTDAPFPQDETNPFTAAAKLYGWNALGGGLVGLESNDPDIRAFKRDHAVAAGLTELAGYVTPYAGWAKLSTKIPQMAKVMSNLSKVEKVDKSPFLSGAMKEIVRFAPLEAGRLSTNAFLGDFLADHLDAYNIGTGAVAAEAAANLAIGGVVGGAFEKLLSGGGLFKARAPRANYPGANLDDPVQLQLRKLREAKAQASQEQLAELEAYENSLIRQIFNEQPKKGMKLGSTYVQPSSAMKGLASSKITAENEKESARAIARLFNVNEAPAANIASIRLSSLDPSAQGALKAVAELPDGFEDLMQFPRLLRPGSIRKAKELNKILRDKMDSVDGDLAYMAREGQDGLYVVAKRLTAMGKAGPQDEWLLFKTDSPGKFFKDREEWGKTLLGRSAWLLDELDPNLKSAVGVPLFDDVARVNATLRATDYSQFKGEQGLAAKAANAILKKAGLDPANTQLYQGAVRWAKDHLEPAMTYFSHNPLAAKLWTLAKTSYEGAKGYADELFYGVPEVNASSPLKAMLLSDVPGTISHSDNNIAQLIDDVYQDADEVAALHRAWLENLSVEEAVKQGLGPMGAKLLTALEKVDNIVLEQMGKAEAAAGVPKRSRFEPLANHYMISHRWRGDWRVPVWSAEGKKLIGVGSGDNVSEARHAAERIKEIAESKGFPAKIDRETLRGDLSYDRKLKKQLLDQQKDPTFKALYRKIQGTVSAPARMKDRHDVAGFIGSDRPWTKTELKNIVHGNLRESFNRIADLSFETVAYRQKAMLAGQDKETLLMLNKRIDMLKGGQGPIGKITNDVADKVLSPFVGKNSASKIVGAMNKGMFALELGFINTAYVMANALTFLQTSMPFAAFVTSAAPERVAKVMSWFPVQGAKTAGHVGVLDIFKLTGRAFRNMANPPDELKAMFPRLTKEGVWDAKFVEDTVGENSRIASDFKSALKGDEGFSRWIGSVAGILPGASEKFSRGHAAFMGYELGKLFNLTDEHLYQFVKEFTEKTMFNYSAADRPLIITGPFGASFGLFKNWMMHYMNWMLTFAGEGLKHGNWNPLLMATAGTTAVGGLPGIVGFGALDSLQKMFTDKTALQLTYETFGGDKDNVGLGDAVYYGLPGLLGFSLQNQMAMPFADATRDASGLASFAYWDRMKAFGGMVGDAYDQYNATGGHPLTDQHVADGFVRAFAPKALYRAFSMNGGFSDSIRSLSSGYPTIDDLPVPQRAAYMLGVNPRKVEMGFEVANELWRDNTKRLAKIQAYGQEWADATEARDYRALKALSVRAVLENVDMSSVIASANSRLAKRREGMIDRQFSPEALYPYRKANLW